MASQIKKGESKDILEQAVADAAKVREAAIENAKEMIMKAFTPKIKALLSTRLNEEDQPAGYDEEGEQERIEGSDDPSEKGEGPAIIEGEEEEEIDVDMSDEEGDEGDEEEVDVDLDLGGEEEEDLDDMGEDDEELDLDLDDEGEEEDLDDEGEEEEIDMDIEGDEDEEVDIGEDDEELDIGDEEGEEGEEDDTIEIVDDEEGADEDGEEVEDEEMYEALEKTLKENKGLRRQNYRYRSVLRELKGQFEAVNLFNAKLVYANKMLHRGGLTKQQKIKMLETFDTASTIREVKIIYKTLNESYGKSSPKRRGSSIVRSVRSINESAQPGAGNLSGRMQELAGIGRGQ